MYANFLIIMFRTLINWERNDTFKLYMYEVDLMCSTTSSERYKHTYIRTTQTFGQHRHSSVTNTQTFLQHKGATPSHLLFSFNLVCATIDRVTQVDKWEPLGYRIVLFPKLIIVETI